MTSADEVLIAGSEFLVQCCSLYQRVTAQTGHSKHTIILITCLCIFLTFVTHKQSKPSPNEAQRGRLRATGWVKLDKNFPHLRKQNIFQLLLAPTEKEESPSASNEHLHRPLGWSQNNKNPTKSNTKRIFLWFIVRIVRAEVRIISTMSILN